MKLVTLAQITLNRVGSANTVQHFGATKECLRIVEVSSTDRETLRDVVINVAVEEGELRQNLRYLQEVPAHWYGGGNEVVTLNIQGINVQYSSVYATYFIQKALKIDGRYFKLDEISIP